MTSDIISISPEEAQAAMRTIREQSEMAKDAIRKVKSSPNMVPSWRGKRRNEFDETVVPDMQKLEQAAQMIDQAAERINQAMVNFLRADGLNI